jgi:hypothetical protein
VTYWTGLLELLYLWAAALLVTKGYHPTLSSAAWAMRNILGECYGEKGGDFEPSGLIRNDPNRFGS